MPHEFAVRQLHLAAYIKAHGGELLSCVDRVFTFRSRRPLAAWSSDHEDSCCRRVDLQLIELRKFLKQ